MKLFIIVLICIVVWLSFGIIAGLIAEKKGYRGFVFLGVLFGVIAVVIVLILPYNNEKNVKTNRVISNTVWKCPKCDHINEIKYKLCPSCGEEYRIEYLLKNRTWKCSKCKTENIIESKNCIKCGFERRTEDII